MTAGTVLSIRYVAQQKFPLKETKNKFYDGYLSLAASLALLSLRKVYVIISEHSLLCILKTSLVASSKTSNYIEYADSFR